MNFPTKCPYCGKDIVGRRVDHAADSQQGYGKSVEIHSCIHCDRSFVVVFEYDKNYTDRKKCVLVYPSIAVVDLPKRIHALSPNACSSFEQAVQAQAHGYDKLVGAGLRIALEWLVWDYLIKVQGQTESDLEKLKLYKRIELMNTNFYTEVCARLIRLFGNDSVHIIKQLDFSVDEVIDTFKMLCALIDNELSIKEINNRLNSTT